MSLNGDPLPTVRVPQPPRDPARLEALAEELAEQLAAAWQEGRRPLCDIEIGHRSTNMSLLGMLSLKLGRSVQWDGEKEEIVRDFEANKLLRPFLRKGWDLKV